MKTLIQIIENALLKGADIPFKSENSKLNNISHPTKQSRRHDFRGPRLGAPKADGGPGKVTRVSKDRSTSYIKDHPTRNMHYTSIPLKRLSVMDANRILAPMKVNITQVIASKRPRTWNVGNNKLGTSMIYNPSIGPQGAFFIKN